MSGNEFLRSGICGASHSSSAKVLCFEDDLDYALDCLPSGRLNSHFKEMAGAASPPNLLLYLLSKNTLQQTLRLGLAGAWQDQYPDLAEKVRILLWFILFSALL